MWPREMRGTLDLASESIQVWAWPSDAQLHTIWRRMVSTRDTARGYRPMTMDTVRSARGREIANPLTRLCHQGAVRSEQWNQAVRKAVQAGACTGTVVEGAVECDPRNGFWTLTFSGKHAGQLSGEGAEDVLPSMLERAGTRKAAGALLDDVRSLWDRVGWEEYLPALAGDHATRWWYTMSPEDWLYAAQYPGVDAWWSVVAKRLLAAPPEWKIGVTRKTWADLLGHRSGAIRAAAICAMGTERALRAPTGGRPRTRR